MIKNGTAKYEQYLDVFSSENHSVIDVMQLMEGNKEFALKLLAAFLDGTTLESKLVLTPELNQQLFHLYVEGQNARLLSGQSILSIGYPLLLDVQEEEILSMPLFFQSIQILPEKESNTWTISMHQVDGIVANPFLEELLVQNGFEKSAKEVQRLGAVGKLKRRDLLGFINGLSKELLLGSTGERPTLLSFPAVDEIGKLAKSGSIQWSAAIGSFPVLNRLENQGQGIWNEKLPAFALHSFGSHAINGSKATAIQTIKEQRVTLVSGAVGSGKTHLSNYLINNGLLKGGKTLVVSPRLNNLKSLQSLLEKEGHEGLNFLFQNSQNDFELWKNILAARIRDKSNKGVKDENLEYHIDLQSYLRHHRKMATAYRSTRLNIYGEKNWEEIAGLFLNFNEQEKWQLLDSYLQASDCSFETDELQEIIDGILLAKPLFEKLGTIQHPLRDLNAGIFVHQSLEEGKKFVTSRVQNYTKKAIDLQRKVIIERNDYADALMSYYGRHYYHLQDQIAALRDLVHDFTTRYDEDLFDAGTWALKINGLFQHKYKIILSARDEMHLKLDALEEIHQRKSYFDFSFSGRPTSIEHFSEKVDAYESSLEVWWKSIGGKVQDELMRLSSKTIQESLSAFFDRIKGVEQEIETFVEELNSTGLYHLPFSVNMLTLSKKQKYLEDILAKLEQTGYHLRDFDLFFDWQSLWYSLSQESRRVIKAMIKVKPKSWSNAFKSWYYHHLLANYQNPLMPKAIYDLEGHHQLYSKLKEASKLAIPLIWTQNADSAKVSLKAKYSNALKQIEVEETQQSMNSLIAQLHEEILELNPICLSAVSQLDIWADLPAQSFDYLLIEEGQLLGEEIISLFSKAKRIVVFNTPVEGSDNEYALTNLLRAQGVSEVELEASKDAGITPVDVQLQLVSGFFDESSQVNDLEATELIRLLNDVKKRPGRKLPSVALVCFTASQRDAIYRHLLTIKQQRLPSFETVLQLERNGLVVVTMDELMGQQFDVIIAGFTFHKAKYFTDTGIEKWEQAIRVLSERAISRLIIVHSLSEKEQFLLYKEKEKAASIRAVLSGEPLPEIKEEEMIESTFVSFLKKKLAPYFSADELASNGHYLIVKNKGQKNEKLILPNGVFARTPIIDFEEEYDYQSKVISSGQQIIPIWPVLWWRNPEIHLERLLRQLEVSFNLKK